MTTTTLYARAPSRLRRWSGAFALLLAATTAAADVVPTGSMTMARSEAGAARLPDGRVLMIGGLTTGGLSTDSTEIYDPASGSFSVAPPMLEARTPGAVVTLADGRILVLGGVRQGTSSGLFLHSAEIFDPSTGTWSATAGSITGNESSAHPKALLLLDGRVLVLQSSNFQLFDPATGTFSAAGSLGTYRSSAMSALLPDGRVLLAGGQDSSNIVLASAELFDPQTGSWSPTGSLATPRTGGSATALPDGRVLIVGGHNSAGKQASAEVYDPATGSFAPAGALLLARSGHAAVALADGDLLVAGGASNGTITSSLERYDVDSDSWSSVGALASGSWRGFATIALDDGSVLFAGGAAPLASAELYVDSSANLPPVADFDFGSSVLTVDFADLSSDPDGTIVAWSWTFGDGAGSNVSNPSHTYAAGGSYSVTLSITDDAGTTRSTSKTVTVTSPANVPPVAAFSFSTNGLTGSFSDASSDSDGAIVSRVWQFGDGNTSTISNPSHTYAAGGSYSVTLTVTDDAGASATRTKTVTVVAPNAPPSASFTVAKSGLDVSFTDTSSDSDGVITSRLWDFGDGTQDSASNPSHTYASSGTYDVTLTVGDDRGASQSTTMPVTVTAGGCGGTVLCNGVAVTGLAAGWGATTATYTLTVPAGATNLRFVTSGGTGDADLYVKYGSAPTTSSYDCRPYIGGNAETCSIGNIRAGTYYVVLRAYSAFSGVSLTGSYALAGGNIAPSADFSFTSSGLTAYFSDRSSDSDGTIVSYHWTFGDGTESWLANPQKTWAAAGTYAVSLTVTDDDGASHTKSGWVSVGSCGGLALCNGVPVTGLSGTSGSMSAVYTLQVPAGASNLTFTISGGSGDADLYVRYGAAPTTSSYDCRPYVGGNAETCTIGNVQAGTYYVALRAFSAYSGVSLQGSYSYSVP